MQDLLKFLVQNQDVSAEQRVYRLIHSTLHDKTQQEVIINGKTYAVHIAGNGCRYIFYNKVTFMEQNKASYKHSVYAEKARAGAHITWGIPEDPNKSWLFIDDDINQT